MRALGVEERGLSLDEAQQRLTDHGPNALPPAPRESVARIFVRQFKSPLIYVLFGAAAIIWWLGEGNDALVIFGILLFNAVVGALQEGRAQNTLHALRQFTTSTANVVREGEERVIPDTDVVPGDIILVREGEKVPADARIVICRNLEVDEAALTGESGPVAKSSDILLAPKLIIAEQKNMLFKGTHVVAGNVRAIVVATGPQTEMGAIAKLLTISITEIPLHARIRQLSQVIILVVLFVGALMFWIGTMKGLPARDMFATVVTLAVSVIPEGLPIVMTLILATGVWRMSKRNALVKRLQAVEALGHASIIAVDKTGTLTKNEMLVQKVYVGGSTYDVTGSGYDHQGSVYLQGEGIAVPDHPMLLEIGRIAALTGSARVAADGQGSWTVSGDPTEAALIVFAHKLGFDKDDLEREHPLVAEIPFSSSIKYHAVITKGRPPHLLVVGAPETILHMSNRVLHGGHAQPLTETDREHLEALFVEFSSAGLRVLALAEKRDVDEKLEPEHVHGLTFVGIVGMKDALRPEVPDALARARAAGAKVVMITGDHKVTARAIARDAGIFQSGDRVLEGSDIDSLSDEALRSELTSTSVFARVTPAHKLRIIEAYRARGETIAMTGDGVNDAPSLVAADLGVAMGKIGTEVAKEAADIILLDDNFGSIIAAIEEGRNIYATLRKGILYFFSTSVGEALVIAGALVTSLPLPLLPAQIIWLNFVTDGFLNVALAMEPKEKGLLAERFLPGAALIDGRMTMRMLVMALPMGIGTLILFAMYLDQGLPVALTVSMTVLAVFQWFNAWNCRSETKSIFTMNPFENVYLIGATIIVVCLQLFAVYNPIGQSFLHAVPLSLTDWLIIIPVACTVVIAEEIRKWFVRS